MPECLMARRPDSLRDSRCDASPCRQRRRMTAAQGPRLGPHMDVAGRALRRGCGGRAQSGKEPLDVCFSAVLFQSLGSRPVFLGAPDRRQDAEGQAHFGPVLLQFLLRVLSPGQALAFLKGLSDKQREEHYFCRDFIRLKKIPTWKEMAKGAAGKEAEEPQYKKDKALNEKLSLFRGDITKLEVDAIVNAANSSLLGGGGVDGCIHRAAGHLLTEECRSLHSCETGKAKITGGYRLPAKYVIHTVGPIAQGEPSPGQVQELRGCYLNSLQLALENRLRSVAFPCISTGVFGYPNEAAAEVVLGTLREWLEEHKDKVERLVICVFLEKDEEIYRKRLPHFFPAA
ncbi:ADP-ribose glycohydrolase MACROD1 [Gracilinanus agilis]|uniref:ADP-ribose glycohydrolase MACROD1 n=1 Tax=Gracilinanus agilis TaxID=191870 RepID=UPI001CFD3A89|nr:ADP-ribose glycohydrolase MACROD1 [Gracilinanus agilis]